MAITPEEDTRENASTEVAQLKEKCEELRNSIRTTEQQLERLQSQNTLLEQYSSGLFSAGKDATTSDLLDQTTIGRKATYFIPLPFALVCNLNFVKGSDCG